MKFPREILLFSPIIVGMLIGQFIVYVLDDDLDQDSSFVPEDLVPKYCPEQ